VLVDLANDVVGAGVDPLAEVGVGGRAEREDAYERVRALDLDLRVLELWAQGDAGGRPEAGHPPRSQAARIMTSSVAIDNLTEAGWPFRGRAYTPSRKTRSLPRGADPWPRRAVRPGVFREALNPGAPEDPER
jgi:hypothetical protein